MGIGIGIGIDIDAEDVIDTTLELASNQAERGLKKSIHNSTLTRLDTDIQPDISESRTPEPPQNTFQQIDNLSQDLYRDYGRLRNDMREGDYLHATRNGLKIGKDIFGGDTGRIARIGSNAIDAWDAIKDGDYGKVVRLGLNIIKDGATIAIGSFGLSTREQMLYDRACSGLNNVVQAERINKRINDNINKNIEKARLMAQYPRLPTEQEIQNQKINDMRQQMREDAASMPTPEQFAEERYSFGESTEQYATQNTLSEQTASTIENTNATAVAEDSNNTATQTLTPAQIAWMNSGGRG